MEQKVGFLLGLPAGDTLLDDLQVTPRVSARFDTPRSSGFHQYGFYGIPILFEDVLANVKNYTENFDKNYTEYIRFVKAIIEKAYLKLDQMYGIYFRGSRQQVTRKIEDFLNKGEIVSQPSGEKMIRIRR